MKNTNNVNENEKVINISERSGEARKEKIKRVGKKALKFAAIGAIAVAGILLVDAVASLNEEIKDELSESENDLSESEINCIEEMGNSEDESLD